jgi:hypothetical protein
MIGRRSPSARRTCAREDFIYRTHNSLGSAPLWGGMVVADPLRDEICPVQVAQRDPQRFLGDLAVVDNPVAKLTEVLLQGWMKPEAAR